jgi:hypothetical protein
MQRFSAPKRMYSMMRTSWALGIGRFQPDRELLRLIVSGVTEGHQGAIL